MNREIKFRAWVPSEKEYFSWGELKETPLFWEGCKGEDCVLEQYVRRKDSFGVEIYEGSVVKVVITDGPGCGENICEVVYNENGFFAKEKRSYGDIFYNFSRRERWNDGQCSGVHLLTYEVIGNIRQNPELLTPKP